MRSAVVRRQQGGAISVGAPRTRASACRIRRRAWGQLAGRGSFLCTFEASLGIRSDRRFSIHLRRALRQRCHQARATAPISNGKARPVLSPSCTMLPRPRVAGRRGRSALVAVAVGLMMGATATHAQGHYVQMEAQGKCADSDGRYVRVCARAVSWRTRWRARRACLHEGALQSE